MDHKILVSTIYLKNGQAVNAPDDLTIAGDLKQMAALYNDSGVDKLIFLDLSDTDEEHEVNLHVIKELGRELEIPFCGGGNVKRLEDVKKLLYAGCKQVVLNGSKPESWELAKEASERFGQEKINISISNVDFVFKHSQELEQVFHEMLLLNPEVMDAIDNLTGVSYVVSLQKSSYEEIVSVLKRQNVRGISGSVINDTATDIMALKTKLSAEGIYMDNFEPALKWSDLKLNSDGMIPVIVQDYKTDEVLMLAYMNEEAFHTTISNGKMTYYSRSRQELWTKGLTSGHIQYVKSLTADCDKDTILAKVSQVGAACHTGNKTCFFREIVKKEYVEKNPLKVFESVYKVIEDRKAHPKEGSYTNYLFDKGIDKILKKVGEECTEIVIAAKNPDPEEIKYEISDFLYHVMVLMVEKGVTWEEITRELAQR